MGGCPSPSPQCARAIPRGRPVDPPDHALGPPVLRALPMCTCCRHYPGAATGCIVCSLPHPCQPSPYGSRVGPRIDLFEACPAFTRVTACTLALSPYFVTRISRRLQLFRYLHSCSGCFRLEHLPGWRSVYWCHLNLQRRLEPGPLAVSQKRCDHQ